MPTDLGAQTDTGDRPEGSDYTVQKGVIDFPVFTSMRRPSASG